MRPNPFALSTLILVCLPTAVAAGEPAASAGLPSGTLAQAFFGLLFIVALLLGTAWFARKLSGGQRFGQGGMRVIGGVALGPRERVVLIEVADTWLVVGIVPGQIRTLHSLPKGSMPSDAPHGGGQTPFAAWLKNLSERRGNAS